MLSCPCVFEETTWLALATWKPLNQTLLELRLVCVVNLKRILCTLARYDSLVCKSPALTCVRIGNSLYLQTLRKQICKRIVDSRLCLWNLYKRCLFKLQTFQDPDRWHEATLKPSPHWNQLPAISRTDDSCMMGRQDPPRTRWTRRNRRHSGQGHTEYRLHGVVLLDRIHSDRICGQWVMTHPIYNITFHRYKVHFVMSISTLLKAVSPATAWPV